MSKEKVLLPHYPRDKFPNDYDGERLKKALARYYCYHCAAHLKEDGDEINATSLAEHAVDQLFEHEQYTDHVYDFLDDETHWIWDVALEVQEKFA